jgi:hydroxymethylpyrimidine pyrophosphatase-like HAD family hydrolase
MKFFALACDYDGTLATDGLIAQSTMVALRRWRATGRKLILVTGRTVADLLRVCPEVDAFDRVVAENGAVTYSPADRRTRILCPRLPGRFINELWARNLAPLSVGEVLAATDEINVIQVLRTIQDLSLELHLEFNKGAVMVLPSGVNKGTGLRAALDEMGLLPHNVVGIGDAENDHAFLQLCECSAAVANALQSLKDIADVVTQGSNGSGIAELIEGLIYDELASIRRDRAKTNSPS